MADPTPTITRNPDRVHPPEAPSRWGVQAGLNTTHNLFLSEQELSADSGHTVKITWNGSTTTENIETCDRNGNPVALFGGTSNRYEISSTAKDFTIDINTPTDQYYIYLRKVGASVRATINVKKAGTGEDCLDGRRAAPAH